MTRLAKFEVDLPALPRPHKPMLHDRDVIMAVMWVHGRGWLVEGLLSCRCLWCCSCYELQLACLQKFHAHIKYSSRCKVWSLQKDIKFWAEVSCKNVFQLLSIMTQNFGNYRLNFRLRFHYIKLWRDGNKQRKTTMLVKIATDALRMTYHSHWSIQKIKVSNN